MSPSKGKPFQKGSGPKVTVIIPIKKGRSPAVTLDTLSTQTFQDFEVMEIWDLDGKGANWARNEGFKHVSSPFVLFSDDDICWHHQALEKMVKALEANPGASFAWGSFQWDGKTVGKPFKWDPIELQLHNYISTMALIRSEDFPGFDETLKRLQDWDLWLTMMEQGKWGVYAGDHLFRTTKQPGSISSGADIGIQEAAAIVQKKHGLHAQVDIIIPVYSMDVEMEALTVACMKSIRDHTSGYRLILIDNASTHIEGIIIEGQNHPGSILIPNAENKGFVKAVNQGLKVSQAPYICILNNDTEVTPHWLEQLKFALNNPAVGLAGPRTDTLGSWQGKHPISHEIKIMDGVTQMLAFFCVLIKRQVVEDIGLLDEGFGVGFGDDDDYCYRAKAAGYKLAFVPYCMVHHHHRTTFTKLYSKTRIQKMQQKALDYFKTKHGLS